MCVGETTSEDRCTTGEERERETEKKNGESDKTREAGGGGTGGGAGDGDRGTILFIYKLLSVSCLLQTP